MTVICYTYPRAKQGIPEARGQGRGPSSCHLGDEEPEEQEAQDEEACAPPAGGAVQHAR